MKTHIKVFVTKNYKFRAKIVEENFPSYEVTIGSRSWCEGKGREHQDKILNKCEKIVTELTYQFHTNLN